MALSNVKINTAKRLENVIKNARPILGQVSSLFVSDIHQGCITRLKHKPNAFAFIQNLIIEYLDWKKTIYYKILLWSNTLKQDN